MTEDALVGKLTGKEKGKIVDTAVAELGLTGGKIGYGHLSNLDAEVRKRGGSLSSQRLQIALQNTGSLLANNPQTLGLLRSKGWAIPKSFFVWNTAVLLVRTAFTFWLFLKNPYIEIHTLLFVTNPRHGRTTGHYHFLPSIVGLFVFTSLRLTRRLLFLLLLFSPVEKFPLASSQSLVIYDDHVELRMHVGEQTVWASQAQIVQLFDVDQSVVAPTLTERLHCKALDQPH